MLSAARVPARVQMSCVVYIDTLIGTRARGARCMLLLEVDRACVCVKHNAFTARKENTAIFARKQTIFVRFVYAMCDVMD